MREQIVSSNSRIGVDLANDRSEIAVDDESHRSFTAAAKDSRQRGRRDYSVDVSASLLSTPAGTRDVGWPYSFLPAQLVFDRFGWTGPHPHDRLHLHPRRLR